MDEMIFEGENYAELLTVTYAKDILKLSEYIRYFQNRRGKDVAGTYDGKQGESNLKFPVYDSTLLRFTAEAATTSLMDPNYMYKYKQYRIVTEADEARAIQDAKPRDLHLLRAILSRYVLEGRYKSVRWTEAVERGIFRDVLQKLMDLYNFVKIDK